MQRLQPFKTGEMPNIGASREAFFELCIAKKWPRLRGHSFLVAVVGAVLYNGRAVAMAMVVAVPPAVMVVPTVVVMVVVVSMPIAAPMVSIVHVNVHSLRASNGWESYSKRGCNNKSKLLHSNASGYK